MATDEKGKNKSKARGGKARAAKLSSQERSAIAKRAALARWKPIIIEGMPEAIREGQLKIGDVILDCYHLNDGRRVFSKKALGKALGLKSAGGNAFIKTMMGGKGIRSELAIEMQERINNPIVFKRVGIDLIAHGYEGTFFIDVCDRIWEMHRQGKLRTSQYFLAAQAEIIVRSSAKVGIIALIDEATGYIKDKRKEEYLELFREFIRNEVGEYEKEFPEQFYDVIYKLYNLRKTGPNKRPKFFSGFTRKYIYNPLAHSNGAILEMLDEKNPVVYASGGRRYRLYQFLTETVGLKALRAHIWQVVGIGNASNSKEGFDRGFRRAFPQSGEQGGLFEDF
jgi:hypothetical protein